jgi:hopanoid biosynthesis associated protein HpnK
VNTRSVIITADDLGLWPEINDAVMAGYDAGIITSASLRVTGREAHSAAVSASMRPGLSVGLHLVLCEGQAVLSHRHIPTLVDTSGFFVDRPLEALWMYRERGQLRDELRAEIRAQIEKFLSGGLFLSHISGHYNLHLHPTVLSILKELAADYPIAAVRKPCASLLPSFQNFATQHWQRVTERAVLRPVLAWGRARSRKFLGVDRVEQLSWERPSTEHSVARRISSAGAGITEFVCHPGSLAPQYDGAAETAIVTSPTVRRAIAESGVELTSYRDVAEGM